MATGPVFILSHTLMDVQEIKGMGVSQSFDFLCQTITENECDYLHNMRYEDFLNTLYWFVVARHKKSLIKKCEECHTPGRVLHTHHKTYEHHGSEHLHLEDLENICEECHAKHHKESHALTAFIGEMASRHRVESARPTDNPHYDSLVMHELMKECACGDR